LPRALARRVQRLEEPEVPDEHTSVDKGAEEYQVTYGAEHENSESLEHFLFSFLSSKNRGLCAGAAPPRGWRWCESENSFRPCFLGWTSGVFPSRGLEFSGEFRRQRGNCVDANHP